MAHWRGPFKRCSRAPRCDGKPQMEMAGPPHFQPTPLQITVQYPEQQRFKPPSTGRQHWEDAMQFRVSPKTLENYSAEEWQARGPLSAAPPRGLSIGVIARGFT